MDTGRSNMLLYDISVILVYAALVFSLIRRKELFSVRSVLVYFSGTWVAGSLLAEHGVFAWPADRVATPHNGSSLFLVVLIAFVYFLSRLWSKVIFEEKRDPYWYLSTTYAVVADQRLSLIANCVVIAANIFVLVYVILKGAPFLSARPDIARTLFWEKQSIPQFQRLFSLFLPAAIVFCYVFTSRGKRRTLVRLVGLGTYLCICVVLSQKSSFLFVMIPLLVTYHYLYSYRFYVRQLITRAFFISALSAGLLTIITYRNMTDTLMVHGVTVTKGLASALVVLASRLTLGQGEPYWRIYDDVIVKKIHIVRTERFMEFGRLVFSIKGIPGNLKEKESFEYWITERLTASWLAETRNLVITFVGESMLYLGVLGAVFAGIMVSVLISVFDFVLKYSLFVGRKSVFVFIIFVFQYKVIPWLQMGNLFHLLKISDLSYLVALLLELFVLSYLVRVRTTQPSRDDI